MRIERVTIDCDDLAAVEELLPDLIGKMVHFTNGCDVIFENEAGFYWGDTPYGEIMCIQIHEGWEQALLNNLQYWNEHDAQHRAAESDAHPAFNSR